METNDLFSPVHLGDLKLKNRIFMSPMTRTRVDENDVLLPIAAEYYSQRAGAGMIISEATYVSPGGKVRTSQPGIFTTQQTQAWKKVTDAVHTAGGVIFAQLSHSGRSAIPEFNGGLPSVGPSALAFDSGSHGSVAAGAHGAQIPKALSIAEIADLVQSHRQAALNAKAAGFDGVELHGGNAGLVEQFLHAVSNVRTDHYGGPIENRARFLLETIDGLIGIFGKHRVGLRLSPHDRLSDQRDPDPLATTAFLAKEMEKRGLGYINLLEPYNKSDDYVPYPAGDPETLDNIRRHFSGLLIVNGGYNRESANAVIQNKRADAVAFARLFLANPDLPYRFRFKLPLNIPDHSTFYGKSNAGYLDYPSLEKHETK